MPQNSRSAFTLIELLIVIAIIAVLAVVVIFTLNPAELFRQSRDSNRLSSLSTLNEALGIYSADVSKVSLGSAFTTYVSIADPTATSTAGDQCQGLGLPALPTGWMYHCASTSTLRNVDGTGWMPVSFSQISFGQPIGTLPVDPTNTTSSGLYYTYTPGGGLYALTATMESQKYLKKALNDGGYDPGRYETGSDISLVAKWEGLVGWWTFDETSGSSVADSSGNGNNGTANGTTVVAGKLGNARNFNGTSDYVNVGNPTSLQITGSASICAWANPASVSAFQHIVGKDWAGAWDYSLSINPNAYLAFFFGNAQGVDSHFATVSANSWHYLCVVANSTSTTFYIDNSPTVAAPSTITNHNNGLVIGAATTIGSEYFNGTIDDVRIYNRALSAPEIASMYNATAAP